MGTSAVDTTTTAGGVYVPTTTHPSTTHPTTSTSTSTTSSTTTTTTIPVTGNITVAAATSLTNAFNALGSGFHTKYPNATLTFSFGSSSSLKTQINNGAPVDVFAAADWNNMNGLTVGLQSPAVEFTTNYLAIIVQPGNPKHITSLATLAGAGVSVATCASGVPIRTYTDAMLTNNGLFASVSANYNNFAANVAGIVTYVANGGSDAGVVYRTDVLNAGTSVLGISIPAAQNVVAHYPIAELASSSNHVAARAFVNYVNSAEGQGILALYGFGAG
jgi:molybdate transport system substrate-binding protein